MTEIQPPYALQGGAVTHPALLFRRMISGLLTVEGVASFNPGTQFALSLDLKVKQNSPAAMNVLVSRGGAYVLGDDVADQGHYFVYNDADRTLTTPAADGTNPRKDIVVAHVKDNFSGQAGDTWALEYVAGTPAGSPVEPSLPASALKLATVDVAALQTTVVTANITDRRAFAGIGYDRLVPRVKAHRAADSTNVSNDTDDFVNFDTEAYDTHGFFTAPGTTFTIPTGLAGFYNILGQVQWAQNTTGYRRAQINVNGTVVSEQMTGAYSIATKVQVGWRAPLSDGDTVRLVTRQTSGGNLTEIGSGNTFLIMHRDGS